MSELDFYKQGTGTTSVILRNEQLYLIRKKYKQSFSLSKWLQETLTEATILQHTQKRNNGQHQGEQEREHR